MPYHSIITVILILAVILLAVLVVMSFGDFAANYRLLRLFNLYKCSPTKKLGALWIDEKHRKWSSKNAERLYDYCEVIDFDIQVDGVSLKKKSEFSAFGGDMLELTANRCKTFERILVVVVVNEKAQEYVNIPVGNSKTQEGSVDYQKYLSLANVICDELDKMRNLSDSN